MTKLPKYTTLICLVLVSCSSIPSVPNEITGTVRSSFEIFSFKPIGSEYSHWINGESYKAKDWSLFEEIYRPLNAKAEDQYLKPSWIYICISARALIEQHPDGVGHVGAWDSDITFTEVSSAKIGKCE